MNICLRKVVNFLTTRGKAQTEAAPAALRTYSQAINGTNVRLIIRETRETWSQRANPVETNPTFSSNSCSSRRTMLLSSSYNCHVYLPSPSRDTFVPITANDLPYCLSDNNHFFHWTVIIFWRARRRLTCLRFIDLTRDNH